MTAQIANGGFEIKPRILFDKTKPGGSFFYNHKVRYFKGNAISPWQWLVKTKWNI